MDMERKQSELIDHFVKEATALDAAAPLADLILEATAHPSLFAFSEILSVPNLAKLKGTQYAASLYVLRLFACGTWSDYKCNAGSLPALVPDQVRKLKQLTVLTLAETEKVLPYDQLMEELDVSNVRELEDFLINECMYAGIVRGKLDQLRRCFEVQFAAGRDLRPEQLDNMIQTLSDCIRSIVCLNLPSFSGGLNPWGTPDKKKQRDRDLTPFVDDGLLEVVGFKDGWHGLVLLAPGGHGTRLAQARRIQFKFRKGAGDHAYMRIDGEPWKQPLPQDKDEVVVEISHLGQVSIIATDDCIAKSVYDVSTQPDEESTSGDSDNSYSEERKNFGAADAFRY